MATAYRNLETVFEYLKHIQEQIQNKGMRIALQHHMGMPAGPGVRCHSMPAGPEGVTGFCMRLAGSEAPARMLRA
eukprot:1160726-Pelagomonas_calceolata.AAC.1